MRRTSQDSGPTCRLANTLALLVGYLGVTVWRTWPLAAHLTTHLPNTLLGSKFDGRFPIWTLAYETHALTTAPLGFADANIYHPAGDALFYGPAALGALPFFAPTFLLSGNPFLAINVMLIVCVALTALGLHLAVQQWTRSALAGLLAAAALLTNTWIFSWVPAVPHYAALACFPWIILFACDRSMHWRGALTLVPLIVLQCLTDVVYVAPVVLVALGLIALGRISRRPSRTAGLHLLGALAVSLLLLLPVYLRYAAVRAQSPLLEHQSLWTTPAPQAWFIPPLRIGWSGLIWPDPATGGHGPADASPVMLALILVGLVCVLFGRARDSQPRTGWTHGFLWTAVGLVMSAPYLALFNAAPMASPLFQALFHWTPWLFAVVRTPQRFAVAALMGLAMLTGVGFAQCARELQLRVRFRWAGALLAVLTVGLLYLDRRPPRTTPFPIVAIATLRPSLLDAIRHTPGPLLELPVGGTITADNTIPEKFRIATAQAEAMCRSIFHWRPILNGYSSFWPVGYPERMALASRLPDPQALDALRRTSGLTSVLVRLPGLPPAERLMWLRFAETGGRSDLRLVARDDNELLFDVPPADASPPPPG